MDLEDIGQRKSKVSPELDVNYKGIALIKID